MAIPPFSNVVRPIVLILLVAAFGACQRAPQTASQAASADTSAPTMPDAEALAAEAADTANAGEGACRLLSASDIHNVLPDAGAGKHDTSRSQYGIDACVWQGKDGRFVAQTWTAKHSVDEEIHGLAAGFTDPMNATAQHALRFETMSGIGDRAMALIETQDQARGVLSDVAVLVTQHNGRTIVLMTDSVLARRARGDALDVLQKLGHSAVQRG